MTAKREDIVDNIQAELGEDYTKADCNKFFEAVFAAIMTTCKEHEACRSPLGTFKWVNKAERQAFNPRQREKVTVAAYSTITFKASSAIKETQEKVPTKAPAKAKTATAKAPAVPVKATAKAKVTVAAAPAPAAKKPVAKAPPAKAPAAKKPVAKK